MLPVLEHESRVVSHFEIRKSGYHRFPRLTNAFSKKFDNHVHMVAIYRVWYSFIKMHETLKMAPAMVAGVSQTLWSMEDLSEKMDAVVPKPGKRGPY